MTDRPTRFEVLSDAEGTRLDLFLSARLSGPTRSALRRWIVEGRVDVDGVPAPKPGVALRAGMQIEVRVPPPTPARPEGESIPLSFVFEDEHLLVVDKPAGLVVHPGHGHRSGTLVNALIGQGRTLAPAGGADRPGIVHRLDRGTSGLLIVAKTDLAHHALQRAFTRREIHKRYLALVWGHPDPSHGTVERPIGRSRANPLKMSVSGMRGRARPAVSHYRTLESIPGFALLEVTPETGRTHQIRVHLQSIHHALVGDDRYGGRAWRGVQNPTQRKALREFDRLALHAAALDFAHPDTGQRVRLQAPMPVELEGLLDALRRT